MIKYYNTINIIYKTDFNINLQDDITSVTLDLTTVAPTEDIKYFIIEHDNIKKYGIPIKINNNTYRIILNMEKIYKDKNIKIYLGTD